jgi:hypothetical protein
LKLSLKLYIKKEEPFAIKKGRIVIFELEPETLILQLTQQQFCVVLRPEAMILKEPE